MAQQRLQDQEFLLELLTQIEVVLRTLVHDRKDLFPEHYQSALPGPWDEVAARLKAVHDQIKAEEFDWRYIHDIGIVTNPGKWERGLLDQSSGLEEWPRALDISRAILGSLKGAFPGLDFVLEYADCVRACLR